MGSNSIIFITKTLDSFGERNEERAYQRVAGIVVRLGDEDSLIALTFGEVVLAEIDHNFGPGQNFRRSIILKTA